MIPFVVPIGFGLAAVLVVAGAIGWVFGAVLALSVIFILAALQFSVIMAMGTIRWCFQQLSRRQP